MTTNENTVIGKEQGVLDIRALLEQHAGRNYELHSAHVNPANVRTLKTIGFDRCYVRAEGPYLWDIEGTKYLDMLSGYGVFGLGRNHPEVRRVLTEFLDLEYPSLVKMEAPLLCGLLAEELKKRMPNQMDMVFFTNSGAEGIETAMKYARCATRRPAILHCEKAFHGLTYGSLSLNGDESFREGFAPFLTDPAAVSAVLREALSSWRDPVDYEFAEAWRAEVEELRLTALETAIGAEISLGLAGIMTLWLGIMRIGEVAGMINRFSRLVNPFFSKLFPDVPKGHPAMGSMMMNFSATMLGLDNAATPMGLKAMKELQEINPRPEEASNPQIMFLVLNTAGVVLIPTSVIALRLAAGAANPADIFIPTLISTFIAFIMGMFTVSIFQKINLFKLPVLVFLLLVR